MISWRDWCWRRCWSRLGSPTRWRPAFPAYTASTPRYSAAGLCAVRAQPHPGAGAGFVAGGRHPERGPAVIRRGPAARRDACGHAGDRFGHGIDPDRRRAPGFCYRAHFQADPVRLHERNCAHRPDQPTPRAFRVFDREQRTLEQLMGDRRRDTGGTDELGGACPRGRDAGSDPAAPGQHACRAFWLPWSG